MSKNITTVAKETSPTPQLPLAELYAHFKPADRPPVDPGKYLDLIMEFIAQDLLNARYQGKPFDEKSLERLMRYENQRLRREALHLRQQKAQSAKPVKSPPPANVAPLEVRRFTAPEPEPQPPVNQRVPETPAAQAVTTNEPETSAEPVLTESTPKEPVTQNKAETTPETTATPQPDRQAVEARYRRALQERDQIYEAYKQRYGYYPASKSKVIPNPS